MNTKAQIFISSTFKDLIPERQAAVESILKLGHIPAGMELFKAGNKSQWDVIQRWISESDIYCLILGGRYGSVEPNSGISYTELEYDYAVSLNKPYFAIVIDDQALKDKIKLSGIEAVETENPDSLKTFRKKVLTKISSFYKDEKDIKISILETVPQLIAEYEIKGWIKSEDTLELKSLLNEVSRLTSLNKELNGKLEQLQDKKSYTKVLSNDEQEEYKELEIIMKEINLDLSKVKKEINNASDLPDSISLLNFFIALKDYLITGLSNKIGIDDFDSFVYYTVCPKLQTYELMENEKLAGVRYRRYFVTKKGIKFLAYLEKSKIIKNSKKK